MKVNDIRTKMVLKINVAKLRTWSIKIEQISGYISLIRP